MLCVQSTSTRVTSRPPDKPHTSKSVFINCPFDDGFREIFRAIIFTVISSGYHPRCALDSTDGAEIRVSKIAKIIRECDWGIHDLSRIEIDPIAGVPRFNMPLELGLHLGARLFGQGRHRRKRALILEAKAHRYDAALSDISGQDIEVHANDPIKAIRCVRNWLSEHRPLDRPPLPGATAMATDYQLFQSDVGQFLMSRRLDSFDDLPHNDFLFTIRDWIAARFGVSK
jgi:hypothetical protein